MLETLIEALLQWVSDARVRQEERHLVAKKVEILLQLFQSNIGYLILASGEPVHVRIIKGLMAEFKDNLEELSLLYRDSQSEVDDD